MEKVVLLTGGNRGNRREYLKHALFFLEQRAGRVLRSSSLYETEPWGMEDETPFLNQAVLMETVLGPFDFLHEIQEIERQLGRRREGRRYTGRTIDIDILFFGERIIRDPVLEIPHPRMTERRFVLVPLHEICPGRMHPVLKEPVHRLLERCGDTHRVERLT